MKKHLFERSVKLVPFFAIVVFAAADAPVDSAAGPDAPFVEAVRSAMSRYADIDTAKADGWSKDLTGCMESEEGGMGHHFGREALIGDGGQLDPMMPEALLYEPKKDGSMELVAVEYLLPFTDWAGSEAPVFMDHSMIANETFGVWTLHLWLKSNPNGAFVDWNPDVTCAYAAAEGK